MVTFLDTHVAAYFAAKASFKILRHDRRRCEYGLAAILVLTQLPNLTHIDADLERAQKLSTVKLRPSA